MKHALLKTVTHKYENAYTLTSFPDGMAEDRMCSSADRGKGKGSELDDPRNKIYGHYYVCFFELKVSGGEPAALHCMWGQEEDSGLESRQRLVACNIESATSMLGSLGMKNQAMHLTHPQPCILFVAAS
jgi:hypothetical protein